LSFDAEFVCSCVPQGPFIAFAQTSFKLQAILHSVPS
jgi:hypothetical protein